MNRPFALAFAATVAAAAANPALAGKSLDKAVESAIACRTIVGAQERLACFDAAAEGLAGATGEAQRQIAAAKEAKKKKERDNFGLSGAEIAKAESDTKMSDGAASEEFGVEDVPELRRAKEEERLSEFAAKAISIDYGPGGRVTLTLDNGQVWRQLDSDSTYVPGVKKERAYAVTLKRAALGSYRARVEELDKSIRVRRIK